MIPVSYPGVYVREVPSGVHTIGGVSTSIAAFFGRTKKGPLDQAIRVLSLDDFERTFAGPQPGSDLAMSVRHFFDNGGKDCYVVRLADSTAAPADVTLQTFSGSNVLRAVAKSKGAWGNGIRLQVDYGTLNPDDTFNLLVTYEEKGELITSEQFNNLSMDPDVSLYAPKWVSQESDLIDLELDETTWGDPDDPTSNIRATTGAGFSQGRLPLEADATNVDTLRGALVTLLATANQFQIDVNGTGVQLVDLSTLDLTTATISGPGVNDPIVPADISLTDLIAETINLQLYGVQVACQWDPIYSDTTAPSLVTHALLRITSDTDPLTEVRIRRGPENDLAGPMMLGVGQGGIELTRYSALRPVPNGIVFMGAASTVSGATSNLPYPAIVDQLAGVALSSVTGLTIDGDPSTAIRVDLLESTLTDLFYQTPDGSDGIRERLRRLARAVTDHPDLPWRGEVWGYHLALLRTEGRFHESGVLGLPTSIPTAFTGSFAQNVRRYALGPPAVSDWQNGAGANGSDGGAPGVREYRGSETAQTGFHALDSVDQFNLMVLPGDKGVTQPHFDQVISHASTYCVQHRAFLLIDASPAWTEKHRPVATASDVDDLRALVEGDHAAVFYPRVQVGDGGLKRSVGPSGMIAGLMARTDAQRGIWKAPAGVEAKLRGVQGLEVNLTDADAGVLNLAGVNCLRQLPNGIVSMGARTLDGREDIGSEWKYISIRRFSLFLQESLYRGTKWVVFEPNDEPLWAQIRLNLGAFMMGLFRDGAFQGSTPDQAFYVKCDGETTTQADRNKGVVNIKVGFAPLKPAEFVIIQIQQMAGELG